MFVVLLGSVLTTVRAGAGPGRGRPDIGFTLQLTLWLWFTVLFANFAEAMAEGRGKAQADTPAQVPARDAGQAAASTRASPGPYVAVAATELRSGDLVVVHARRPDPGRRRGGRRGGLGGRVGDHRANRRR